MIAAPEDAALFDRLGGQKAVRRWPGDDRRGSVSVVRVEDGDHALFSPAMREAVVAEVRSRVAATFPVHT